MHFTQTCVILHKADRKNTFFTHPLTSFGSFAVGGEEVRKNCKNEDSSRKVRKVSKEDRVKRENMVHGSIGQF